MNYLKSRSRLLFVNDNSNMGQWTYSASDVHIVLSDNFYFIPGKEVLGTIMVRASFHSFH